MRTSRHQLIRNSSACSKRLAHLELLSEPDIGHVYKVITPADCRVRYREEQKAAEEIDTEVLSLNRKIKLLEDNIKRNEDRSDTRIPRSFILSLKTLIQHAGSLSSVPELRKTLAFVKMSNIDKIL